MYDEKLAPNGIYRVADRVPENELAEIATDRGRVAARWTLETRAPKRGEWFLSGATVEAYRAGADLDSVYPIARLVRAKVTQRVVEY